MRQSTASPRTFSATDAASEQARSCEMFAGVMAPVRIAAGALACLLALAPSSVIAEDADALIKQGVELRRAGKDQEALEQFRRAYELAPSPRAVAQLGLAEQALGRWVDAEAHVDKALEAPQDPWIAKYHATLEASRVTIAGHLGSLEVRGPEGAEVRVDGQLEGTLPLSRALRLPAGSALLDVSSHGRPLLTRAVNIVPGQLARENLAAPHDGAPRVTVVDGAPRVTSVDGASPAPAASPGAGRRRAAWIATWLGAGLAAVGGGGLLVGEIEARHWRDNGCTSTSPDPGCSDSYHTGTRARAIGDISLIAAGAAGITATVLFLSGSPSRHEGEARVACLPDQTRLGAACTLRF
jgi:hypothetical protein